MCTITSFFIIKSNDVRATTRFDASIEIVIIRFEASIEIVIAESATNSVVINNVATANAIASNAITNIIIILLKTRLI